jgi:hypothetical protein
VTYEPTLTPFTPYLGAPGVSVIFSALDPNTASLNVWRQAGGRTMPVRGGANAPASTAFGVFDADAPFGIPSAYWAEMFDVDGVSLGITGTTSIQIDSTITWVANPLAPHGATTVRTAAGTGQQVAGQNDVTVYYPVGRRAGVAVTGPRRGLASVPLRFYADTTPVSDALDAMFGTIDGNLGLPPIVCVRLASGMAPRLPSPLYVAVPAPTQTPVNAVAGGTVVEWDLTGPEVDPPTPELAPAVLSRADLDTYYTTRATRDTAYASRLAMDTDYSLAGYADGGGTPGAGASEGIYGAGIYGAAPTTVTPNSGGAGVSSGSVPAVTSNGDGTATTSARVTDNGDGTATI